MVLVYVGTKVYDGERTEHVVCAVLDVAGKTVEVVEYPGVHVKIKLRPLSTSPATPQQHTPLSAPT